MPLTYIEKALIIFTLTLLSSCMPWTSKFKCPKPPLGKCQSIEKTYRETDNQRSYRNAETLNTLLEKLKKCGSRDSKCRENIAEEIRALFAEMGEYNRTRLKTLSEILSSPPVPLRYPPKIVRIYILPYVDSRGNLVMGHYRYFTVDEGKWILGDYLIEDK